MNFDKFNSSKMTFDKFDSSKMNLREERPLVKFDFNILEEIVKHKIKEGYLTMTITINSFDYRNNELIITSATIN